jgi:hypothetical protein
MIPDVQIEAFEVHQHPDQHLPLLCRLKKGLVYPDHSTIHPIQQFLGFVLEPHCSTVVGIDEEVDGVSSEADKEMAGKIDAFQRQPQPPSYLQNHDPESEWDAELPVQNVVEEGVSGIIVSLPIPPETVPIVKSVQEFLKNKERGCFVVQTIPGLFRQKVQFAQISILWKLKILLPGHHEGGGGQVDLVIPLADFRQKALSEGLFGGGHDLPSPELFPYFPLGRCLDWAFRELPG